MRSIKHDEHGDIGRAARTRTDERRSRAGLGSIDRAQPERRPPAQALRGRAVAEDEPADSPSGVDGVERLGDRRPGPIADGDRAARLGLEVAGPVGLGVAGRDEHAPVGFLDEADGDRDVPATDPAAGDDPGDLAPADELRPDLVRQRPRCQDLPSVATAGA
jgi:hypothetical protein